MTPLLSLPSHTDATSAPEQARRASPPIVLAMLAQGCGAMVTLTLLWLLPVPDAWGELLAALCHGMVAALVGRMLRLAIWWIPINVLFVPVALMATGTAFSPAWALAGFVALALVYWSTYRTQVPLYLTSDAGCKVVMEILQREQAARFLDLGSGSGSVLAHVSRRHPRIACEGYELAPLPYLVSRLRLMLRGNCRVNWRDFWNVDLAQYDVVYAFLSPVPMAQLWEKVRREMRPGTLFISNSFPVIGVMPKEIITIPGGIKRKLYLWRL